MRITIACSQCLRRLYLPSESVGQLVQCPSCRATFHAMVDEPSIPLATTPYSARTQDQPAVLEVVPDELDFLAIKPPTENNLRLPRRPPKPLVFRVTIRNDTDGILAGACRGETTLQGVRLTRGGAEVLALPRGTQAQYLEKARLAVTMGERRLELEVRIAFGSNSKLAADLVSHLLGVIPSLQPNNYRMPWYLVLVSLLPLSLAAFFPGNLVWSLAGLGVAAISFLIARQLDWMFPFRFSLTTGLAAATLVAGTVGKFGPSLWQRMPSPITQWQPYFPERSDCQLVFPTGSEFAGSTLRGGGEVIVWKLRREGVDLRFLFSHYKIGEDEDPRPQTLFDGECRAIMADMPGSTLESGKPLPWKGYPGHQYVVVTKDRERAILRFIFVQGHLYLFAAWGPHYRPESQDVMTFFQSFKPLGELNRWPPSTVQMPPDPAPPPEDKAPVYLRRVLPTTNRRPVLAVAVSPEGESVAVGQGEREGWPHLVVWNTERKEVRTSFLHEVPSRAVRATAFDPDGLLLAAGDDLGEVHLFEWPGEKRRRDPLKVHKQPVEALAFSPDGSTLASLSRDALFLHDTLKGKETGRFSWEQRKKGPSGSACLVFHPEGNRIISAIDHELIVHNHRGGIEHSRPALAGEMGIRAVAITPDGKALLTATKEELRWWTMEIEPVGSSLALPGVDVQGIAFSPDGRFLAVAGEKTLLIFNATTRKQIQKIDRLSHLSSVVWCADKKTIAATSRDGTTNLFDAADLLLPR